MDKCEVRVFPRSRKLVIDSCEWGRKKHIIHALIECDVTRVRAQIREHKAKTGETLSFTAFIASCVGRAVAEHRACHAYRKRRKLILFEDVDIGTLVEHDVEHDRLATFHVIRAANGKSFVQIHDEIRAAQKQDVEGERRAALWRLYLRLPKMLRMLFYRWLDLHPETRKKLAGTVVLTAIGMAASGGGWGVPIATGTLTITVGGIETKPAFVEGRVEAREFLSLTVSFDHDVVDGVPAARFVGRLREIIEST